MDIIEIKDEPSDEDDVMMESNDAIHEPLFKFHTTNKRKHAEIKDEPGDEDVTLESNDVTNTIEITEEALIFKARRKSVEHSLSQTVAPVSREQNSERVCPVRSPALSAKCAVSTCGAMKRLSPDLTFFRIPTDPYTCQQWLTLMNREDLKDHEKNKIFICDKHFPPEDMTISLHRKFLKKNVYPSLAMPILKPLIIETVKDEPIMKEEPIVEEEPCWRPPTETAVRPILLPTKNHTPTEYVSTEDAFTQVNFETADEYSRKIHDELIATKKTLSHLQHYSMKRKKDHYNSACEILLPQRLADFAKGQGDLQENGRTNRYNYAHKLFSLSLLITSEKAYTMLSKDFRFPCLHCVSKQHYIPASTTFGEEAMTILKVKVGNMSEREKYCSVAMDKIELKDNLHYHQKLDRILGFHEVDGKQKPVPAQFAFTLIVRGIFEDWMQPVGFCLLSEPKITSEVSVWIDKMLGNLLDIGLKIKAYIPTFTMEFLHEAKGKDINENRPYFYRKDVKIYCMFDAPELLRHLRNAFMTHNFHYKKSGGRQGVAKCQHVLDLYWRDSVKKLRMAPKLTLNLFNNRHQPVRFLVHLFSKTIATALSFLVDYKVMDKTARDTAEVLLLINDLFDLLNSSSVSTSPYKTAYTGDDKQKELLNRSLQFFHSLKTIQAKTGIESKFLLDFITGFQITISAMVSMFEDLQTEGHECLFTRRLNHETTLKLLKSRSSKDETPSLQASSEFMVAFRRLYYTRILKPTKAGNTSSMELTSRLMELTELTGEDDCSEDSGFKREVVTTAGFKDIVVDEKIDSRIIAAFLLQRCLEVKQHKNCETCLVFANMYGTGEHDDEPVYKQFTDYIIDMEREFQKIFDRIDEHNTKLAKNWYENIRFIKFEPPCICFPLVYFQKTFIMLRMFQVERYHNMIPGRRSTHSAKKFVIPKLT